MENVLIGIGLAMVIATVVPLLKGDAWWIRVFDFPRLQIAAVLAVVAVAYPFFIERAEIGEAAFFAMLAACLSYQCYMMFPYTKLASPQVQQSRRADGDACISLVFANVLMENRNAAGLKELISEADPDVFLVAEADEWWEAQLAELEREYQYSVHQPQDNTYGMILYSRLELVDPEIRFLVEDDIPSIHTRVRMRSGREVDLRCLHPRPPFPTEDETATNRDAELLIVGKMIKEIDDPAIVMGDLNDVAWSRTNYLFQDISGLLDPRIGRGFYHTFHAEHPLIRFPLDHFFHSNHFRLVDFRRLPYFGSDHFPVYIKLSYESDAEFVQDELHADIDEANEAVDKIKAAVA